MKLSGLMYMQTCNKERVRYLESIATSHTRDGLDCFFFHLRHLRHIVRIACCLEQNIPQAHEEITTLYYYTLRFVIKVYEEYRDIIPRPRMVCQETDQGPRPGVLGKTAIFASKI